MTPYYEHAGITIYHGDVRDTLSALPGQSVQCCVTSPPYWGLRDYGTAKWEGGDETCAHREFRGGVGEASAKQISSAGASTTYQYRETCRKCGAMRIDLQLGLEQTPQEYVSRLVDVFREVRRVLRDDGTLWLNLGDSYAGARSECGGTMAGFNERYFGRTPRSDKQSATDKAKPPRPSVSGLKPKDLVGIPWRVAFALQADGWYLRSDIIWSKPNPMPESVTDRPTKAHEYLFLMSKSERYYYDADAIAEKAVTDPHPAGYVSGEKYAIGPMDRGGHSQREGDQTRVWAKNGSRNARTVWTITTQPFKDAHFAVMPQELVRRCIAAGTKNGDVVLDPFVGSGTVAYVAKENNRRAIGIDLNAAYCEMATLRLAQEVLPL